MSLIIRTCKILERSKTVDFFYYRIAIYVFNQEYMTRNRSPDFFESVDPESIIY